MKPVKLTFEAFGPYPGLEIIDFSLQGDSGIYLITGETGSGKTTIFDALSFALFGKASGNGRDDYQMLRSDFAGIKVKTFVELEFYSGKDMYTIKRTIKKAGQDVVLTLPGGTAISGDRNVKAKIVEIIGLDREQFAQIVMIAQNDFMRFLNSGTDEKVKILRRIFETSLFRSFQEDLKLKAKEQKDELEMVQREFRKYDIDVYKREEQITALNETNNERLKEIARIEKDLAAFEERSEKLVSEAAVAEEEKKRFTALAAARECFTIHQAKRKDMSDLSEKLERGRRALEKVKPFAFALKTAHELYTKSSSDLKKAEEDKINAEAEWKNADRILKGLPDPESIDKEYMESEKKLNHLCERLKTAETLMEDYSLIHGKQKRLSEIMVKLAGNDAFLNSIPSLEKMESDYNSLKKEYDDCLRKKQAFEKMREEYLSLDEKYQKLTERQTEMEILMAEHKEANDKYNELNNMFLREQAGVLSAELKDGQPCPVCGSIEHPAPAKASAEGINEKNVNAARKKAEKLKTDAEKVSAECNTMKAQIEVQSDYIIKCAEEYIPKVNKDKAGGLIKSGLERVTGLLDGIKKNLSETEKKYHKTVEQHNKAVAAGENLLSEYSVLKTEVTTLIERFNKDFFLFGSSSTNNTDTLNNAPADSAGKWCVNVINIKALFTEMKNGLKPMTLQRDRKRTEVKLLKENLEITTKRYNDAEIALRAGEAAYNERLINQREMSQYKKEEESKLNEALRINGFDNYPSYEESLLTEEEVIKADKTIQTYRSEGELLISEIGRLEKETAGREEPDAELPARRVKEIKSKIQNLRNSRDILKTEIEKTGHVLKEINKASDIYGKTEKAYSVISRLSERANGKLDFETYAQMAYFTRVLEAANMRLGRMSQTRFRLSRNEEKADKRTKMGLDIEVFDNYTGKSRPASSLSGGESFMASLSLALGLSDVVRQKAGGIHIEAMFIDEGFGSLDADALDAAIKTLSETAGQNRLIGIISHVPDLRERISKQICIKKGVSGSSISIL